MSATNCTNCTLQLHVEFQQEKEAIQEEKNLKRCSLYTQCQCRHSPALFPTRLVLY